MATQRRAAGADHSLLWTGVILGIGLVGTLDEVVLHQWLRWHNFYVHTTPEGRVVSDGIFHALTSGLLLIGAMRLWALRGRIASAGEGRTMAAGILLGMGGFNLYDGTVQHKVLQLHPVRENVENSLPYDLAFNAVAVSLLVIGWLLWRNIAPGASAERPGREQRQSDGGEGKPTAR